MEELSLDNEEKIFKYLRKLRREGFIFRGVKNEKYELLPSAWRNEINTQKIFQSAKKRITDLYPPNLPYLRCIDESIVKEMYIETRANEALLNIKDRILYLSGFEMYKVFTNYLWHVAGELYIVNDFLKKSNLSGLKVPILRIADFKKMYPIAENILYALNKDKIMAGLENRIPLATIQDSAIQNVFYSSIVANQKILIRDQTENMLKKSEKVDCHYFSDEYLPAFALAQHHGVPTRFLDWTTNPLKALFFALSEDKNSCKENAAVFAINKNILELCGISVSENFHHADMTFLHKQDGVLTNIAYNDSYSWYLKNKKWPTVDEIINVNRERYASSPDLNHIKINKLIIPNELRNRITKELIAEGITRESLMPTYSHVAGAIKDDLTMEWPNKS